MPAPPLPWYAGIGQECQDCIVVVPPGVNPRKVDEEVWKGDAPTEMLSNINAGGAQHARFTYMLWCTGGIVPL